MYYFCIVREIMTNWEFLLMLILKELIHSLYFILFKYLPCFFFFKVKTTEVIMECAPSKKELLLLPTLPKWKTVKEFLEFPSIYVNAYKMFHISMLQFVIHFRHSFAQKPAHTDAERRVTECLRLSDNRHPFGNGGAPTLVCVDQRRWCNRCDDTVLFDGNAFRHTASIQKAVPLFLYPSPENESKLVDRRQRGRSMAAATIFSRKWRSFTNVVCLGR